MGRGFRIVVSEDQVVLQEESAGGPRTHNFAGREPITSAPTVGRDLGKWRSAQRFLVVPW
jgi:hypothetical protein